MKTRRLLLTSVLAPITALGITALPITALPITAMSLPVALAAPADAPAALSDPARPQLTAAQAESLTMARYLGDWTPRPHLPAPHELVARFTVGPSPEQIAGRYPSVQSAIDAAVALGGSSRIYIAVVPGTYREVVCVPVGAPPITLYGSDSNPARTTIVFDHANPTPKDVGSSANPCSPNRSAATYGTGGSATFAAFATGFQAKNLTFANDYAEGTYVSGNQSAVALSAAGDQQVYDNVRVLGNQDSLQAFSTSTTTVARQYYRSSLVTGDTDFVFGRATAVFDRVELRYLSTRKVNGAILAPSTAAANPYGFLFVHSRFTVDSPAVAGTVQLGRAWDESVGPLTSYLNGVSPNGQAVIRDSQLDAQIRVANPWGASTIGRPYCSVDCVYSANRFAEYHNVGPGRAVGV